MKKVILKIVDEYLVWVLAIGGVLLLLYGIWFQTEGLTLAETPLSSIFMVVLAGCGVSAVMMTFLLNQTKKKRITGGKMPRRSDLKGMLRGYMITFVLCLIIVYTAKNVSFFYLGLAGMSFSFTAAWYYLIWGFIEKKKDEAKEAA